MKNLKDVEILYSLVSAIKESNLLKLKKEKFVANVTDQNGASSDATENFLSNLEYIVENKPEIIVNYFSSILSNNGSLTRILTKFENFINLEENPSPSLQMEMIALFWETSELFSLISIIMSRENKISLALKNPFEIYKYFKFLGLSDKDKQKISGIRNCNNHIYRIQNKNIIDDQNKIVCTQTDIDTIYTKITDIIKWYGTVLILAIYYYPKFFSIATFSILTEYRRNKNNYIEWYEALKYMAPNLFKEEEIIEKKNDEKIEPKKIGENIEVLEKIGNEAIVKINQHIITENQYPKISIKTLKLNEFISFFPHFKKRLYEYIKLIESIKIQNGNEEYNEMVENHAIELKEIYSKIKLIKRKEIIVLYDIIKTIKNN